MTDFASSSSGGVSGFSSDSDQLLPSGDDDFDDVRAVGSQCCVCGV